MQVSVVIPTYNRAKDLDVCLSSISAQTILPKEIIIVDDSETDEIKNLIEQRKEDFRKKNILLKYIRNKRERSSAIARNIGIENATGDIILFLDSDVILDKNYIKEILKVYKEKPNALGVQGYITSTYNPSELTNMIRKFLFIDHWEKNACRVLPSTCPVSPNFVDRVISCEWLSGCNQSYKKKILEKYKFDENLKRYSFKEDMDLSYRIFKKYPNSLFMTPYAKLIHNVSQSGRLPKKELIYMKEIYSLYFFYKNIEQTVKNKLIYLWSRIGYLFFKSIEQRQHRFLHFKYLIGAYITCLRNLRRIREGDLEFFNKTLR